jgi:phenylacetate-CoA ligase
MSKVSGRSDDMIIIRGVNVFPSQVEEVLLEMKGILPHYQLVIHHEGAVDRLEVRVEVSEEFFFDEMKKQRELIERIRSRLSAELGIVVEVRPVEKKTIVQSEGKAKRVVDKRKF